MKDALADYKVEITPDPDSERPGFNWTVEGPGGSGKGWSTTELAARVTARDVIEVMRAEKWAGTGADL